MIQVPLGVVLENENNNEAMLTILQHFHKYVPMVEETGKVYISSIDKFTDVTLANFHKLFIGGDQLTAARVQNVKKHRINSASPSARLEGLVPCVEDWYTQTILLEVRTYL